MIRRLSSQAIATFTAWRERRRAAKAAAVLARRIAAANPEMVKLQEQIAERAKRHRNAAPLRKQLRDLVIANLAREQGRTLNERSFQ